MAPHTVHQSKHHNITLKSGTENEDFSYKAIKKKGNEAVLEQRKQGYGVIVEIRQTALVFETSPGLRAVDHSKAMM